MARNKVVHWELMGPDPDAIKSFYGSVFDWPFQTATGFEGYHLVDASETGVGGAVGQGPEQIRQYVTIYVEVDSIDDTLAQVEQAGGKVAVPRTEIPGTGLFGMFVDPAENLVGLVEGDAQRERTTASMVVSGTVSSGAIRR